MNSNITYLAIPFSAIPQISYAIANEVSAELMSAGKCVFSPISMGTPIADYLSKEQTSSNEFWMEKLLPILKHCSELLVVVIGKDGHKLIRESKGCKSEIEYALIHNIPINYLQYEYSFE